mgnify:CR=1 FL=1
MNIPKQSDHPRTSRTYAREWWWREHDIETYECPDCGRGLDRVYEFDVHHRDRDPTNNDPENLVALCARCHAWRHHGETISGLDTQEWQEEFLTLGNEGNEMDPAPSDDGNLLRNAVYGD